MENKINANNKTKEEREQEKKELLENIEKTFFKEWLEKSEVFYTLDEKKQEIYREVIINLYKLKVLNIRAIKDYFEK